MERFTRAGLTFPVDDRGPSDGPPVVLLHGFPQSPAAFDLVTPRLHAAGLRTLAPTQRGYAATARPRRRRDYAVGETAADVLALLDAADLDRAHLVGHDWGAAPVWHLAATAPDRVVTATVLSTPHPRAMGAALLHGQALRSWYMAFFQLPLLPERRAHRSLGDTLAGSGLPDRFVSEYTAALAAPGAATGALNWYRGLPFSRPAAGPTRVPTTYVWGRNDFALGRWAAERTADHVAPGVPYRFLEVDAGHWLPETAPDVVADAIIDRIG